MFNVFMDDKRPLPKDKGDWLVIRDLDTMIKYLEKGMVNHAALDHDMGDPRKDANGNDYDGTWLMKQMAQRNIYPKGQITIHSDNIPAKIRMEGYVRDREHWQEFHRQEAEKRKKRLK